MYICVDFDGTCVEHVYPSVGKSVGAEKWLSLFVNHDAKLILWTMRSGLQLDEAVAWFSNKGIPLYGINENPSQYSWTSSPKAYGNIYIDDAAIGCPLIENKYGRPYVDWEVVGPVVMEKLKNT